MGGPRQHNHADKERRCLSHLAARLESFTCVIMPRVCRAEPNEQLAYISLARRQKFLTNGAPAGTEKLNFACLSSLTER